MKTTLINSFLILIFLSCFSLQAQTPQDSVQATSPATELDTLRLLSDRPLKSPWGAVLRSAVLPGWGQIYNRSYVKSAVFASAHVALIWRVSSRHQDAKNLEAMNQLSAAETVRENRNLYIWYTGLAYLITMVDAYVDAYLFGFDDVMDVAWQPPKDYRQPAMVSLRIKL